MRFALALFAVFSACAANVTVLHTEHKTDGPIVTVTAGIEAARETEVLVSLEGSAVFPNQGIRETVENGVTKILPPSRSPFATGRILKVPAGKSTLRFETYVEPDFDLNNVKIGVHERIPTGWDPPIDERMPIPIDDLRVTEVRAGEQRHSLRFEGSIAGAPGAGCAPKALTKFYPAFDRWTGLRETVLEKNGLTNIAVDVRVYGAANQESFEVHSVEWACRLSGPAGYVTFFAPYNPWLLIDPSSYPHADAPRRFAIRERVVEAAAGTFVTLPFEIETTGSDASAQGVIRTEEGRVLKSAQSVVTRPAWNLIASSLRVSVPSTLAPGDHELTFESRAGQSSEGKAQMSWTLRINPDMTKALRKSEREQAAREAAVDIASDPAVSRPIDTRPLPGQPAAVFTAEVRLQRIRMVMVLDTSGSMALGPIVQLKKAVGRFARQFLDGRNELALVLFSTKVEVAGELSADWGEDAARVEDVLRDIAAEGQTNLAGALTAAERILAAAPKDGKTLDVVFVFTDGAPNVAAFKGIPCQTPMASQIGPGETVLIDQFGFVSQESTGRVIASNCRHPQWNQKIPFQQAAAPAERIRQHARMVILTLAPTDSEGPWLNRELLAIAGGPEKGMLATTSKPAELLQRFQDIRKQIVRWASEP